MIEGQERESAFGWGADEQEKQILFSLEGETYCVPIVMTQEIIADYSLTYLPNLPELYNGVLSLRGEAIPVVNLRKRFGLPDRDRDRSTRVIIVDLDPAPIGVEVDRVNRVVTVAKHNIEAPPELTCGQRTPYITGVSELAQGKFTIHLDMEEILTSLEKIELEQVRDSIVAELTSQAPEPVEAAPGEAAPGEAEPPPKPKPKPKRKRKSKPKKEAK
jgi:purine-binding chemotaxis protein CheW